MSLLVQILLLKHHLITVGVSLKTNITTSVHSTFLRCHQWPFSHLTDPFNHIKAMTHAPASHCDLWLECGMGPVSWTQESWPALQGLGLCKEALMCCDRCACLSACPWQRAAKSNANSQGARRAYCLIQFPPLLSQHTTTWKEPLFHIPLGLIASFSAWCISFQLFIWRMAAMLSGRPLNRDYFCWTLRGQWKVTQDAVAGKNCGHTETWRSTVYVTCQWWLSAALTAWDPRFKSLLCSFFFFSRSLHVLFQCISPRLSWDALS